VHRAFEHCLKHSETKKQGLYNANTKNMNQSKRIVLAEITPLLAKCISYTCTCTRGGLKLNDLFDKVELKRIPVDNNQSNSLYYFQNV
jgi:hypothetical protein